MSRDGGHALLVVPAWNEEAALPNTLVELRAVADSMPRGARILVVNDGSADGTSDVARAAGVRVLDLPFNCGVGAAMRAGFQAGRNEGAGAVVQVDADGQHDPRAIPGLVAGLQDCDLVVGSRFAEGAVWSASRTRLTAMRGLRNLVRIGTGLHLTDVTSGFRASGPRAIELFADHYPSEYLADTVESLVLASRAGLTIKEKPVVMRARQGGVPSQRPTRAAAHTVRASAMILVALSRAQPALTEASS